MTTEGSKRPREISVNRKILWLSAALACIAPACAPLWAQNTAELNEVVVTATRVDSDVLDSPSAITVISRQQIVDSGARDFAGVINGQPGVVVKDHGPAGAAQSVSLRGSTSSQVLVLLDGIRLNSSRDGEVDLSSIPIEIIDHIEIVRGGESVLYGPSAIGGVINIITKKGQKPEISLSITNGSYIPHDASSVDEVSNFPLPSTYTQTPVAANPMDLVDNQAVNFSLAGKVGDVGLTGGGSFTRAANGFTWNDTTHINNWRRRTNADSMSGSGYAGLESPLLGGRVAVKGVFDTSDTGAPGSLTTISQVARQTDTAGSGSLAWKTDRFFADSLTFDLKAFYRYDVLSYNDPAFPSVHRTQTASLDMTQKLTFSEHVSAIYGGNSSYEYADSTNYANPNDRIDLAGFVSVPVTPIETLTITPSARYDFFSDFAGSLSYSLSVVLRPSEELSLRASFGSSYRVPTLNDLYWYDPLGFTAANPNLQPETSYDCEIGGSLAGKSISIDASLFTRTVFNNIIWLYDPLTGPFGTYLPKNLTRTLFPGAEIHMKVNLTAHISLDASYTFLYSLLLNDGTDELTLADNRRVPYAPVHSLSAKAGYEGKYNVFSVELIYVGREFTDTANTASSALPGYFVGNADYRFSASENLTFTLALKNIFNTLYYTQLGYPMPPFSIETGVRLHW